TYLLMTKALDYFDPSVDYDGDLSKAFANSDCRFMLVSFSTDWRFPPERTREIVTALLKAGKQVSYLDIEADQGHDAFLLPVPRYMQALTTYLDRVKLEISSHAA
ncbi:MAG TPA: homoserine O-acetyltransferase, partial [Pseudohongiella sp.]|nr:homoserine O-acetyltransferase [Pseudohongiella sp.]